METAITQKSGEMCIESSLKRSGNGLIVTVRAHPRVEEFMSKIGGGAIVSVNSIGRHWNSLDGSQLNAYGMWTTPIELLKTDDGTIIDLLHLGSPLSGMNEDRNTGRAEETLNLSFLRLVGISEGLGVSFIVKSVYSLQGMKKLRDQLQSAQTVLYNGYLRPVEFTIATYTQQLSL